MTPFRAAPDYADWQAVLALLHTEFAYMEALLGRPSAVRRLDAAALAASAAAGAAFLIEDRGAPVACAFSRRSRDMPDAWYLGRLAVAGSHRGRGLARLLVAAAEAEARRRGFRALTLETGAALGDNIAVFARLGFARHGKIVSATAQRPAIIVMRKPLA